VLGLEATHRSVHPLPLHRTVIVDSLFDLCDRVQRDRVQRDRVQCDRVQCDRVQCDRVQCDRVQRDHLERLLTCDRPDPQADERSSSLLHRQLRTKLRPRQQRTIRFF
jgi:hypothetical protein